MSENTKKIPLTDSAVEDVTGGNVQIVCNKNDHYCYGARTPDVRYEFQSKRAVDNFVTENYDYYGEAGIFQAMIDAGIITPMN